MDVSKWAWSACPSCLEMCLEVVALTGMAFVVTETKHKAI